MQEHEGKQGAPRAVDFSALANYGQLAEKGGSSADCEEKKDGNYRKAVDCIYRFIDNQDLGDWPVGLSSMVKRTCRRWLLEGYAPTDEVLAQANEMQLDDDQIEAFTNLIYNELGISAEPENVEALDISTELSQYKTAITQLTGSFSLLSNCKSFGKMSKEDSARAILLYREGQAAQEKLDSCKDLSGAERSRLNAAVAAGQEARDRLVLGNLGLVISVVRSCSGTSSQVEDLVQDGILGLLRAVERFEPKRAAFSTYATIWVRKYVLQGITVFARQIPLSAEAVTVLSKVARCSNDYEARTGKKPSVDELAEMTGLPQRCISNAMRNEQQSQTFSADAQTRDHSFDPGSSYLDMIEDPTAQTQYDEVLDEMKEIDIKKAIYKILPPTDAIVICNRFGLEDGRVKTQGELGELLGCKKQRIQQIEKQALQKLQWNKQYLLESAA